MAICVDKIWKKILLLILVFLMIYNVILPVKAVTNIYEDIYISYHSGYTLLKNGKLKKFSDKNRIISEKIEVEKNIIYNFKNLSAKYGNCFYAIYDSDNNVIDYKKTADSSNGEIIDEIIITMPSNASYFRMACDLNVKNKLFEVYCDKS